MTSLRLEELAQAVASSPHDDALLTVFADALLQHGDPRSMRLGELVVIDQKRAKGDTSLELVRRSRALESEVRKAVRSGLPADARVLCTFARGLVQRVEIRHDAFTPGALEAIVRRPELSTLTEIDLRRA